jgi:hypothetical protein
MTVTGVIATLFFVGTPQVLLRDWRALGALAAGAAFV